MSKFLTLLRTLLICGILGFGIAYMCVRELDKDVKRVLPPPVHISSAVVQARQTRPASAFPRARARLVVSQSNCAFPGVGAVPPNRIQTSGFRQAGPVATKDKQAK